MFDYLANTPDASEVMGAGIVKPQPDGGIQIHIHTSTSQNIHTPAGSNIFTSTSTSSSSAQGRNSPSMGCEECASSFTPFKRKKCCKDCGRHFCSQCVMQQNPRPSSANSKTYQCRTCHVLLTGTFTRSQLLTWKVKDLKALLNKQNINISKCKEKSDLIDVIFTNYGGAPNLLRRGTEQELLVQQMAERMRQEEEINSARQSSESNANAPSPQTESSAQDPPQRAQPSAQEPIDASQQQRPEPEMTGQQATEDSEMQDTQPVNPHIKLDDVKTEEEIDLLDIKSLKRLLLNNFVDFKGCREKWELQDRVKRLWRDNQANKKKYEEQVITNNDSSILPPGPHNTEDDLCKICMDAAIDCVLLECGHMISCTKCGKQLSECPICRQYVVRAVHTFRS